MIFLFCYLNHYSLIFAYSLWEIDREGVDCGDEAASWISRYIGTEDCRVYCYTHDLPKTYCINAFKPWMTRTLENDAVTLIFSPCSACFYC